jgi:hypothetical protein
MATMKLVAAAFRRKITLALIVCAVAGTARAEIIDRIMAVVGGQPIMLSDVHAMLLFRLVDAPAGTRDPLAYALDRLIERSLMLAEVDRFQPPEPAAVEISVRIQEIEQRAGSPEAFAKALAVTGMTREQLQRHIRDDLRITTYLNQRFGTTRDAAERAAAIAVWTAEIRRRADVIVQYQAR